MKFGVVGVIAFIIDYGLLALLTEVFGVNYLVSATISFTASVIFNYLAIARKPACCKVPEELFLLL